MHELSIALSILDAVADEAERRGGVHVVSVHLRLGLLSGVVKESLISAFTVAREGSALREAQLVIEDVPILAYCPGCDATRAVVSVQELCCVECGAPVGEIVSGRELEVFALEINEPVDSPR